MNIQKIGKLLVILFIVTGFAACNEDETENFELIGEVLTTKRTINGEDKYAQTYYAYANQGMDSAVVILPNGTNVALSSGGSQNLTYMKEPSMEDYSAFAAGAGTYEFVVKSNDLEYTATENHVFTDISIPTIDSVGLDYANQLVGVAWENYEDANTYVVRLFDEDRETVFISYYFADTAYEITLDSSTGSWQKTLQAGSTYTIEVQAMVFDEEATDSDYFFHIQSIAIGSTDFIWQE
ncbi:hypothetical protein [uncultured Draconibacterium sp.]|uniref:hypothetical protein n=1 Tax=uncultured Draconibacterium sp. TaxID=1573823 RepID=UPI0025E5078B|nr:hypothetical protein [uncultured Draconibacterium sp.]